MRLRPGAVRRKLAAMAMHAGELPIDAAVVRDLIDVQFPRWRGLPIRRVTSSGTVNAIFRLGDRLAARFPLQGADPAVTRQELESEAAAARELAAATRFPVPALVTLGEPGPGYPLPWSVQTWLPGRTGDEDDPSGEVTFASDLAEFIAAVRAISTRGRTFTGRRRGGDLKDHDDWMHTDLEWERSKAWAFEQAMGLVWYYADSNPVMSRLGRATLDRIMSAAEVLPEPL
jgi:aminoglycoside phosphotransferase (APT) family kinase protein